MEILRDVQNIAVLVLLLGIANALPILARKILGNRWEYPVDAGLCWLDGMPMFGSHKTWRGVAFSVVGTTFAGALTPFGAVTGFWLSLLSMAGDLLASFIKRRLGLGNGARAPGLDQGVEALLPLVVLRESLGLSWDELLVTVLLFAVLELSISPVLYRLGFRRNPY